MKPISTSVARKISMALSAMFLIIFLIMHLSINMISVFSKELFNEASHFMGTNPVIQFAMQPVLIFGVVFHFVMGFILEYRNHKARSTSYVKFKGNKSSSFASRSMLYSGLVILAFLVLHFIDFWVPEMNTKYILGDVSGMINGEYRYFEELQHKFTNPYRVAVYIISFFLLSLHLWHGFQSSFQSIGFRNKNYTPFIIVFGNAYSLIVPLGFIVIALFHFFKQ